MAAKERQLNLLDETRSPLRNTVLLAWPIFLENVLTTLVSYADTAMVGTLGAYATAAVSISNSLVFLLNGVIMALGVGVTALISQSVGAGDILLTKKTDAARRVDSVVYRTSDRRAFGRSAPSDPALDGGGRRHH